MPERPVTSTCRLARSRRPRLFQGPAWLDRWGGREPFLSPLLLASGWLLAVGLLALLPLQRIQARAQDVQEAWFREHLPRTERVAQAFRAFRPVPPFATGREPSLRRWVEETPFLLGIVARDGRSAWVRHGMDLRPATPGPERDDFQRWGILATPPPGQATIPDPVPLPEASRILVALTTGGPWIVVKAWEPGSEDVDRFLSDILPPALRFGLLPAGAQGPPSPRPLPGKEDRQVLSLDPALPSRSVPDLTRTFGEAWIPVAAMSREASAAAFSTVRREALLIWSLYGAGVILSGGVLLLVLGAWRRRQGDARRLATLAHGLKTPLAVLRMRCDSALVPDLPREAQEEHLLRLGDGVEQLMQLIENGLEDFRPRRDRAERLGSDFFRQLHLDLEPVFALDGRRLDLDMEGLPLAASPRPLQSALQVLVENALVHGRGRVLLEVRRTGRLVRIRVEDEGEGPPAARLEALGAPDPLTRKRAAGRALRAGQGLGLLLLADLARREGWGWVAERGPGFAMILELPQGGRS